CLLVDASRRRAYGPISPAFLRPVLGPRFASGAARFLRPRGAGLRLRGLALQTPGAEAPLAWTTGAHSPEARWRTEEREGYRAGATRRRRRRHAEATSARSVGQRAGRSPEAAPGT